MMACHVLQIQTLLCLFFGTSLGLQPPKLFGNGFRKISYYQSKFSTTKNLSFSLGESFTTFYFSQPVDHFDSMYTGTFKQRYLVSTKHWDRHGGPIFFYTGNEGDIVWFAKNTGIMPKMAAKFRAMIVFAEHRYYGESLPFGKQSFQDPKKLSFLTSEQALADFSRLIGHLKSTVKGSQNSSVVAFGGSYGGMLAAWFRMKYAGVVQGSIAASAPIWQFTGLSSCNGPYRVITDTFKKASDNCPKNIRESWNVIDEMSKSEAGLKFLTNELKMCSPLNTLNINDFKDWVADTWFDLSMVDYPYPANFLAPLPAWPVKQTCLPLSSKLLKGKALISGLGKALQIYHNFTGQQSCFNISVSSSDSMGELGWSYQTCTEMVMPFCTNGVTDMFPPNSWNFTQFSLDCFKTWKIFPRKDWIRTIYGGKKIKSASNIVFSNGLLDPWSAGGVQKSISDSLVAVIIPEGAHHLDLRFPNPADPKSVVEARKIEEFHISQWLKKR